MATLFQFGVWILFLGAVQCKERTFNDSGLMIKTYEHDLQRGDEAMFKCDLCMRVLNKIFKLVGKELSRDGVNTALNRVCEKVLKFVKNSCLKFIKRYREKLVQAIMSAKSAPGTCKHLGLCKSNVKIFFP